MKVYLDNIIFSLQRTGGISIVWENLIRGIKGIIPLKLIEYEGIENNIHRATLKLGEEIIERKRTPSLILEQFRSPHLTTNEPFIFHSSYYRFSNDKLATNVTTVHDFIYEMTLKKLTLSQRIRCALTHRAIRKSDYIVCISENTRNDLFRLIPETKQKPVSVIYNGVSNDYHPLAEKDESLNNYLLFVGGRQSYKNFQFAIEMAARSNHKLLICGNDLTTEETKMLTSGLGAENYKFVLRPSNEVLNYYYNSVDALIYPSSYEGFGIPVLEAQRAGCPVIALNASSIPEIIGEKSLLIDNLDWNSFKSVENVLKDKGARAEIIESGLINSQRFSWEKMGREYLDLYNSIK